MQLLSVIVPVYNVEKQLPHCIKTICNQTYHNLEIILVDDGSTDSSGTVCDTLAARDERIKVVHKKNGGLSSARNAGLEIASGDYYGFVDSDDYIELDMYQVLISCLEENPSADIACAGIIRENPDGQNQQVIRCPKEKTTYPWQEAMAEILCSRDVGVSVCSKVYRKEVFTGIRFPVGQTNEDAHIVVELHKNHTMVHSGMPHYHYIVRDGSITSQYHADRAEFTWKNARKIRSLLAESDQLQQMAAYYEAICLHNILISYYRQDRVQDKNIADYFQAYKQLWLQLMLSRDCALTDKIKCLLLRTHSYKLLRDIVRGKRS